MLTHLCQSILNLLKQRNILKANKCTSDLNETPGKVSYRFISCLKPSLGQ